MALNIRFQVLLSSAQGKEGWLAPALIRYQIVIHRATRLCSACARTARTCARVTPGNHFRKSSIVAPVSRFSNRARTGTRVPRKTKLRLALPLLVFLAGNTAQASRFTLLAFIFASGTGEL